MGVEKSLPGLLRKYHTRKWTCSTYWAVTTNSVSIVSMCCKVKSCVVALDRPSFVLIVAMSDLIFVFLFRDGPGRFLFLIFIPDFRLG